MSPTIAWQRLPVIALIFFFLSSLRLIAKHAYNALPAFVAIFVGLRSMLQYWPYALLALIIILLITTVLRYRRFTFALEPERIRVREGVFSRVELNLDYERIQQADIRKPIWFKPFNLAILQLQSAGSKGSEVEVAGLPVQLAEQLQYDIMQATKAVADESGEAAATGNASANFELQLPHTEILRVGLIQNALIVAGVLLALLFSNQVVSTFVVEWVEGFVEGYASAWQGVIILIGFGIAALMVLMFAAVLFYFNQYYRYHLRRVGDRVAYTAGLITHLSRSFRMPKLQLVEFRQGVVARLLRRSQMRILQAGGISDKAEGRFTVPVLNAHNKALVSNDLKLPTAKWHRVGGWIIPRYWLIPSLAAGWIVDLWAAPIVFVVMLLLRWLWWRNLGWYFDGNWIAVRQGLFGCSERFAPAAKMQRITLLSGPIQRRLGFCGLKIYTAGGALTLPWLRKATADKIYTEMLTLTANNNKRWM